MEISKENAWGVGLMLIGTALAVFVSKITGAICGVLGITLIVWAQFRKPPSLQRRTYKLADDLVELQREQGPEPPRFSGKGSEEEQRRVLSTHFNWQHDTYFKYIARLRDQVVKTDSELAAERVFTKLSHNEINPPETTRQVDLRKIITALRSAADELHKQK